jgi:hypothetical protein
MLAALLLLLLLVLLGSVLIAAAAMGIVLTLKNLIDGFGTLIPHHQWVRSPVLCKQSVLGIK